MSERAQNNVWATLLNAFDSLTAFFFVGLLISLATKNPFAIAICFFATMGAFATTFKFREKSEEWEDRVRQRNNRRIRSQERDREETIMHTREVMRTQRFIISDERILALRNTGVEDDVLNALMRVQQRFKGEIVDIPGPQLLDQLDLYAGRGRIDPVVEKLHLYLLLFEEEQTA